MAIIDPIQMDTNSYEAIRGSAVMISLFFTGEGGGTRAFVDWLPA
jgi:hypothetical protein